MSKIAAKKNKRISYLRLENQRSHLGVLKQVLLCWWKNLRLSKPLVKASLKKIHFPFLKPLLPTTLSVIHQWRNRRDKSLEYKYYSSAWPLINKPVILCDVYINMSTGSYTEGYALFKIQPHLYCHNATSLKFFFLWL